MTHEELWRAIDTLAAEKGLSPSGLARAAGLDPTSFNRSKRTVGTGRRWPGTESLARILAATGTSLESFATLVGGARVLASAHASQNRVLPWLALSRAGSPDSFDETGRPAGPDWGRAELPRIEDPDSYAIRVDTGRLEPVFREGSLLVMSPGAALGAGDRAIGYAGSRAEVCLVLQAGADGPMLAPLDPAADPMPRPDRTHRIVWASL